MFLSTDLLHRWSPCRCSRAKRRQWSRQLGATGLYSMELSTCSLLLIFLVPVSQAWLVECFQKCCFRAQHLSLKERMVMQKRLFVRPKSVWLNGSRCGIPGTPKWKQRKDQKCAVYLNMYMFIYYYIYMYVNTYYTYLYDYSFFLFDLIKHCLPASQVSGRRTDVKVKLGYWGAKCGEEKSFHLISLTLSVCPTDLQKSPQF